MANTKEQFDLLKQEFDAETTRIGEKIEQLAEKLKDGGLSAEEEAEIFVGFSSVAAALKALGRDPEVVEDPLTE